MKILKLLVLVVLVGFYSCSSDKYSGLSNGIYADIQTDAGDVLIKLEYKKTPLTVANFVSLAEGTHPKVTDSMKGKPFYNGLKFHQVTSFANGDSGDFMIQGGCPIGDGSGYPGYKFDDEFPKDSTDNLVLKHNVGGVVSMANFGKNTNGSQFFITLVPTSHLNGVNTIFGKVTEGMNIVKDSIVQSTVINKIDIIKIGYKANSFDAPQVFIEEYDKRNVLNQELAAKKKILIDAFLVKMEEYETDAETTPSGLKIYFLKKGDGLKPGIGADIRIHYSVFFTNGNLLDTNRKKIAMEYSTYNPKRDKKKGYEPFTSTYSMDAPLIQGFKEGLQKMKFGDRAVLFIPYHLAYGASGGRGIPAKSDLIFELEMYPKEAE
ncbi:MAG: peptidylprolyl isomerase [Flavobacteriaceae bacterium]